MSAFGVGGGINIDCHPGLDPGSRSTVLGCEAGDPGLRRDPRIKLKPHPERVEGPGGLPGDGDIYPETPAKAGVHGRLVIFGP